MLIVASTLFLDHHCVLLSVVTLVVIVNLKTKLSFITFLAETFKNKFTV